MIILGNRVSGSRHSRKPICVHSPTYTVPGRIGCLFNELPRRTLLGNWVSASDYSRKPKSGLLGARVQSKPNTRANNRVIDEARFELADALLKEKNSANLSGH